MTSILLTGPTIEPISLEETKTFLRVEHDDENQLIAALIAGARNHIEAQTQTALKRWRAFPIAKTIVARLAFKAMPAKLSADFAERIVWTFSKRFHPGILVGLFCQRQFLKRLSVRLLNAPRVRLRLATCSLGACTPLPASGSTNSKRFWRRVWQPNSRKARARTIRSTPSPWRSHIVRADSRLANCCTSQ